MKVILRQNIDKLGRIGQIVDVKDGYALNYLIPKGFAYVAVKGNVKALEEEKKIVEKRNQQELKAAEMLASELEKISVTIPVQVGEEDKIFGSVTTQMIADALKEKGHDIDKRKIELEEQIKTLGIYNVNIKLHPSVSAKIKLWVVRE
ncbi:MULTISPECIES: 50S ribosomal protein L9 [Ignavibacterium]|jgi:large subunit ribosomal protein L9|uniref:50S ribosomal protein L9 n=1 Tax=Ignavibacterium TaxID=795750 RepID=UPI0025C27CC4|nr:MULTISPECIES: 50S ribosomal protein L9 [Ignavibacterium]MBI5660823.1 50S ribosomal protein L9 [Ignavibacterium album]